MTNKSSVKVKEHDIKLLNWLFLEYKDLQIKYAESLKKQGVLLIIGLMIGFLMGVFL